MSWLSISIAVVVAVVVIYVWCILLPNVVFGPMK